MTTFQREVFSLMCSSSGPVYVCEVARALNMRSDTVYKVVLALESRGLTRSWMQGRSRVCSVAPWVLL